MNVIDVIILCTAITALCFMLRRYHLERRALRERKARAARILAAAEWRRNDPHPPPPLPNRRVSSEWTNR